MTLTAYRCPNDHLFYPNHPRCPHCGASELQPVDLTNLTGEVITWTESSIAPPGIKTPHRLAIVEFEIKGMTVRILGKVTESVAVGDEVRPRYTETLRDSGACIRISDRQRWDGYEFEPIVTD